MRLNLVKNKIIESFHQIKYTVMREREILDTNVGPDDYFFPRSALKPFQALPLLTTGAFDSFGLDERHIALACASHAGQIEHTRLVLEWLQKLQIQESQLVCGAHRPYDQDTADELIRRNQPPGKAHNNCSGKHSGFLTVCKHLDFSIEQYEQPHHPFQRLLREQLEEYFDESLETFAIDGCSIPAPRMSLQGYAKACDHFLLESLKDGTNENRISSAFMKHCLLTSGKTEFYYLTMFHNQGRLFLKVGAEGVLLACIPDKKITITLKVLDGAERALPPTAGYLLKKWGGIAIEDSYYQVKNRAGIPVGEWILEQK